MLGNLFTLHLAGLVHNDIKPLNIVYSRDLGKWVFIDFGVSCCPKEQIGQESEISLRGTFEYIGPQMRQLGPNQRGKVDLFHNDLVGLQKSVEKMLNSHTIVLS